MTFWMIFNCIPIWPVVLDEWITPLKWMNRVHPLSASSFLDVIVWTGFWRSTWIYNLIPWAFSVKRVYPLHLSSSSDTTLLFKSWPTNPKPYLTAHLAGPLWMTEWSRELSMSSRFRTSLYEKVSDDLSYVWIYNHVFSAVDVKRGGYTIKFLGRLV